MALRLKQWNLLTEEQRLPSTGKDVDLSKLFSADAKLYYCNNIPGLFESVGIEYDPGHWRLFVNSSKESMKAVLIHNGNTLPSVPVTYSTTLKENYLTLQLILEKLNYNTYRWLI